MIINEMMTLEKGEIVKKLFRIKREKRRFIQATAYFI